MFATFPDVLPARKYSSGVIDLFTAGILRGDNEYGAFRSEDNITRAEVAAIVNRVVLKNNRLQFTLRPKPIDVVVGYTAADEQTRKLILSKVNKVADDQWLGRELSDVELSVLAKIKADPKNCYPEFDSIEYFNDVKGGADYYAGYSNFIMIVLMCNGDVRNYDAGVL